MVNVILPVLVCVLFFTLQKRRRRIDRSMIGEPTNFVHTAHVGSGDIFSGMNSVSTETISSSDQHCKSCAVPFCFALSEVHGCFDGLHIS